MVDKDSFVKNFRKHFFNRFFFDFETFSLLLFVLLVFFSAVLAFAPNPFLMNTVTNSLIIVLQFGILVKFKQLTNGSS